MQLNEHQSRDAAASTRGQELQLHLLLEGITSALKNITEIIKKYIYFGIKKKKVCKLFKLKGLGTIQKRIYYLLLRIL